jgi:DNA-binding NarL/FixJ family response regulator
MRIVIGLYIISKHAMFRHGLESLLNEIIELDIVGQSGDVEHALIEIETLHPRVVIFDSDNSSPEAVSEVMPILSTNSDIRVIALNLQSNDLFIYQATQWLATEVADLVEAIKYDLSLPEYSPEALPDPGLQGLQS